MKSHYIIISLLIATFCFPQIDTTKKDFYPLKIGNLWQYKNETNHIATEKIIGDTLIDGYCYYSLANLFNISSTVPKRIDSFLRVITRWGGPFWGDTCGGNTPYESSVYHLNEEDSTAWEICDGFTGIIGDQLVRFNRIRVMNIFGQTREVMEFDYGGAFMGDTIWFYGARLVKGIGMIEERYYEGSYWILQGCIIDGIQYGTVVSNDELPKQKPTQIVLHQNFPNPFNPSTTIKYEIPESANVNLKVYNTLGQEIITLIDEIQYAGIYKKEFNGNELNSGVYFAVLTINQSMFVSKMLLIK